MRPCPRDQLLNVTLKCSQEDNLRRDGRPWPSPWPPPPIQTPRRFIISSLLILLSHARFCKPSSKVTTAANKSGAQAFTAADQRPRPRFIQSDIYTCKSLEGGGAARSTSPLLLFFLPLILRNLRKKNACIYRYTGRLYHKLKLRQDRSCDPHSRLKMDETKESV